MFLDVQKIKEDFPILKQKVRGHPLVYLDNAATTHSPSVVLKAVSDFYSTENSAIRSTIHTLGDKAVKRYFNARQSVQKLLKGKRREEIIFTSGTTEAINLVAETYGQTHVTEGDEVIVSIMDHHANFVPWQRLCAEKKAQLKIIPLDHESNLQLEKLDELITERTKIVAVPHASNVLGTINPIKEIAQKAHKVGAIVLVDGAQAIPHGPVNVQDLDCDFYAFSGHKYYAPTGVGVLYGKYELLKNMSPYQLGGGMINEVTLSQTTFADPPERFEAGTPNVAGAIGLETAINYLAKLGYDEIKKHEQKLLQQATNGLKSITGIKVFGDTEKKVSVLSFSLNNIHSHDVGTVLDQMGIAVRVGHHCAQPLMTTLGTTGTVRASFGLYNTESDVKTFIEGVKNAKKILS